MKPIHYILICCLLGLVGCSKDECECRITSKEDNVITNTQTEFFETDEPQYCSRSNAQSSEQTVNGVQVATIYDCRSSF